MTPFLPIVLAARDSAIDEYAVSIPLSTIVITIAATAITIVLFEQQELQRPAG